MRVKLVPGCELSHFGRTKYDICYSMYGSHTPALPCIIAQKTNPGQEIGQPKARIQRAPSLNLGIHSEVCFHAGRFRVISEVQYNRFSA